MPNLKIYIERDVRSKITEQIDELLERIKDFLCAELNVPAGASQMAVITVDGLEDQSAVNAELVILQKPDRSRADIEEVSLKFQKLLQDVTQEHVTVRILLVNHQDYVTLK